MPESVQSCFELSIHFPVFFFPRTIFITSSRLVRYTDKCMESSKHDWTLAGKTHLNLYFIQVYSPGL